MKWSGPVCEMSKAELRALLAFTYKPKKDDRPRPSLEQVQFEPERGRVLATDGKALLVFEAPIAKGEGESFGVARSVLEEIYRLMRPSDEIQIGWMGDGEIRVIRSGMFGDSAKIQSHGEQFPDTIDQIIPAKRSADTFWSIGVQRFDVELLARLAIVQKAVGCAGFEFQFAEQLNANDLKYPGPLLITGSVPSLDATVVVAACGGNR